jgi:hypothetical protein
MGRSDFLYADPSWWSGLARTLDISGTLGDHSYNESRSGEDADRRATKEDWYSVGDDLAHATECYSKVHGEK